MSTRQPKIGDRVRSFDFDSRDLTGERACYVEGVIRDIRSVEDCDRYEIHVDRIVFGGKECDVPKATKVVLPPVNGTRTTFGRVTAGVDIIED